ncbi:RNA polymerase sigma factor [Pedobacter sp. BMA]|uniref:RNA polymerase sigma factor n=1 Tax=Pedobacter sp. BMA TaxID=1663685 RepID=UPI00069DF019|nr:RNA polymerase sigma factor [Pedobacter sp. BMA]
MIGFILATPSNNAKANNSGAERQEQVLVSQLQQKDRGAFKKLYKMYAANLLGVITLIVKQHETAEDLLQESFLKISRNIASYDENKSRLFTWMLNIARNTAIDHIRKKSTKQETQHVDLDESMAQLNTSFFYSIYTDGIGIKKITTALPHKQQLIIDLVYYQGYSHSEAAEKLNMPLGSLKTSLRAAILLLRKSFNNEQKSSGSFSLQQAIVPQRAVASHHFF